MLVLALGYVVDVDVVVVVVAVNVTDVAVNVVDVAVVVAVEAWRECWNVGSVTTC